MPDYFYGLKPGDILIAKEGTDKSCLTPGRDYKVYSAQQDMLTVTCDGVYGDTHHYITGDWEKDFTRRES